MGARGQMKILTRERIREKCLGRTAWRAGALRLLSLTVLLAVGESGMVQWSVQAQNEPTAMSLDLGMGQGTPGASVVIPVILKVSSDVDLGALELEVSFPNALVTFQEVRNAIGADASNAEVSSSVEDDATDKEQSIVKVSVTAEPGMWIPTSTVVDLIFKVDDEAELDAVAILQPQFQATTAGDNPGPISPTEVDPGEIGVGETTLVFSCFFYMH